MQIVVSGKHLDIGDTLRQYVEENLQKNIKRYFDRAIHAHVTIAHEPKNHLFETMIIVNEGSGSKVIIKGNGQANEPYASVNQAITNLEKQLRKYKSKIRSHRNHKPEKSLEMTRYIISPNEEDTTEEIDQEKEISNNDPLIIAEKATQIEMLSVKDAVMKMDLLNLPAYVFININTHRINLVHYRNDGNITWLDTNLNSA